MCIYVYICRDAQLGCDAGGATTRYIGRCARKGLVAASQVIDALPDAAAILIAGMGAGSTRQHRWGRDRQVRPLARIRRQAEADGGMGLEEGLLHPEVRAHTGQPTGHHEEIQHP